MGWRESLRFALGRLGSIVLVSLLVLLCELVGLLVLHRRIRRAVDVPVRLHPGAARGGPQGSRAALRRSRDLVRGRGWHVFATLGVGYLIGAAISGALAGLLVAVLFVSHGNVVVFDLVTGVVTLISTVLVTPFTASLTMAVYFDLRVRKEGFDLWLLAQKVGGGAPEGGFPAQPGAPQWQPVPGWGAPPPAGWGRAAAWLGAAHDRWATARRVGALLPRRRGAPCRRLHRRLLLPAGLRRLQRCRQPRPRRSCRATGAGRAPPRRPRRRSSHLPPGRWLTTPAPRARPRMLPIADVPRRLVLATLAVALVVALPAGVAAARPAAAPPGPDVSRQALAQLAAQAEHDPAALARLRQVRQVDGQAVDLRASLATTSPDELRIRLRELAGQSPGPAEAGGASSPPPSTTPGAAGGIDPAAARRDAGRVLAERRFKAAHEPQPLRGVLRWIGDRARPVSIPSVGPPGRWAVPIGMAARDVHQGSFALHDVGDCVLDHRQQRTHFVGSCKYRRWAFSIRLRQRGFVQCCGKDNGNQAANLPQMLHQFAGADAGVR